ncbi:MAG TPA: hypothetical protein VLC52_14690, partial [Anaerolineae bacterium]|nr:hypothetical protein [Anaerolineae bacterium]
MAWEAPMTTHEEPSEWADLFPGSEELPLEQEEDAGPSQATRAKDWGPDARHDTDAGSPEDEAATPAANDEEPAGQVWAARSERAPFFEHALYAEAMHALAAGNGSVVASSLEELAKLYPEEPGIRDLLMRMELRSAVAQERALPADHRQAAPALQSALTLLLLMTLGLVGIAGFYVAYKNIVEPIVLTNRIAAELRADEYEIELRMAAHDWNGALQTLQELEDKHGPGDWIAESRAYASRQKQLGDWYDDALAAEQAGDLPGALALLEQLEVQEPGYRDVADRIHSVQTREALEKDWLEAEDRVQAEDWEAATTLLLDIRHRTPEFRNEQVKERLFQIY